MKKLVVIADGMITVEQLMAEDIQKVFGPLRKEGLEIRYILDDGMIRDLPEGTPFTKQMLRIETEGPDWVEHSEEFLKEISDADYIISSFSAVGNKLFNAAKNLKVAMICRSGIENIDLEAAKKHGITVCNAPGRVAKPVADFTLALILGMDRRLYSFDMKKNNARWLTTDEILGESVLLLKDATIGLVGYGRIGEMVVNRLKGFECTDFIAYDPYANKEHAEANGVRLVSLEEVMSKSDFVSIHARLTPETENLVGEKEIALMKPTAFLINTARAGLIDENALIKALEEHRIKGAGLDVYRSEPLPEDSPFFKLDNVIITPHCAGAAGKPLVASYEIVVNDLLRIVAGKEPVNKVC